MDRYINSTCATQVRVGQLVHDEGLDFAGWEDGLMIDISEAFDRSEFLSDHVYGYTWNNIWEWGGGSRAYVLANNDYDVSEILVDLV